MYHIKDDRRVKKSVDILEKDLKECLGRKPFREITVTDLCVPGHVSRATFYRIFDSPVDILHLICDNFVQDAAAYIDGNEQLDKTDKARLVFTYILDNYDTIDMIIRCGRHDILQGAINQYSKGFVNEELEGFSDSQKDFLKASVSAVIVSIIHVWDQHNHAETPEELLELYNVFMKKLSLQ